ncbi:MAG: glycoside hydrolase family 19 protein [Burkholderiales bacterium]
MDVASLIAAGLAPTQAKQFAAPLTAACAQFDISTPARQAAFVAQCEHESAGFVAMEEGLYYRSPERIRMVWPSRFATLADAAQFVANPKALANRVYGGRNGNGDEASGDGWAYRGSGPLGLTGRSNFRRAGLGCGMAFDLSPDLVRKPVAGCLAAAWFFSAHGCNELADRGDIDAITRVINGPAMLGATERRTLFRHAFEAFS